MNKSIHTFISSTPDREFHSDMLKSLGSVSSTYPNLETLQSTKTMTNIVCINASNNPRETFLKQTKKLHQRILEISNNEHHKFSDL